MMLICQSCAHPRMGKVFKAIVGTFEGGEEDLKP